MDRNIYLPNTPSEPYKLYLKLSLKKLNQCEVFLSEDYTLETMYGRFSAKIWAQAKKQ